MPVTTESKPNDGAYLEVKNVRLNTFAGIWLCSLLVAGLFFCFLYGYEKTSGESSSPPKSNYRSPLISQSAAYTLLLFIHPKCPCSRSSLNELAKITTRCPNLSSTVFFLQPENESSDWSKTDLWQTASKIPGVRVAADSSGKVAREYHVFTSGDALLYSKAGALLFHGGITSARGHEGDNQGESIIKSIANGQTKISTAATPVFGCALFTVPNQIGEDKRP